MAPLVILKKSFLLLFFLCQVILSKKLSSSSLNGIDSQKLSECRRCKVLTDSFEHWLDKTSRGKYEGGDAAWEEAKLKSYSRSEIRLVEIQEGLCSELKKNQDSCYSIAEEAEQVLENWWFHKDPNSVDLYTWLCIENLQYCCPESHYGEECKPCLRDRKNRVCSEKGKCDGDGTRKGNGTCVCNKGYSGVVCEECAKNYYRSGRRICDLCHKACDGCSGEGADSCLSCSSGYHKDLDVCVDIDECSLGACKSNQFCINTEGSFNCYNCDVSCKSCMGDGTSNCTACEPTHVLWFGMCIENDTKSNIISNTYRRLAMYIGLIIISLFTVRSSWLVASFAVLIISVYIYFLEANQKMNTVEVLLNEIYNSSNNDTT